MTHETRLGAVSASCVACCLFAAVGGVCSLASPPYLFDGGTPEPAYGWPLIPWLAVAIANIRPAISMTLFFVTGLAFGMAQPGSWRLMAGVAMATPAVLHAVNILHDWTVDATSHNLFPFEFLMYAFVCAPALLGAYTGSRLRGPPKPTA